MNKETHIPLCRNNEPIAYASIVGFIVVYIYDWDDEGVFASMSPIDRHPKYLPFKGDEKVFFVGRCGIPFADIEDFDKKRTVINHFPIDWFYGTDADKSDWQKTNQEVHMVFNPVPEDAFTTDWERNHPAK